MIGSMLIRFQMEMRILLGTELLHHGKRQAAARTEHWLSCADVWILCGRLNFQMFLWRFQGSEVQAAAWMLIAAALSYSEIRSKMEKKKKGVLGTGKYSRHTSC